MKEKLLTIITELWAQKFEKKQVAGSQKQEKFCHETTVDDIFIRTTRNKNTN